MPQIKVNGIEHTIDADPQMPLLWAIRDLSASPDGAVGVGSTVYVAFRARLGEVPQPPHRADPGAVV
jgi:hypothetical protein